MNRYFVFLGTLFLTAFLTGCGGSESVEEALEDRGTMDVLEQAAEDEYTPAEDGRLTDEQVEIYVKVRGRELELAKAAAEKLKDSSKAAEDAEESGESLNSMMTGMKALRDFGAFMTTDIRAAQELGYNTAEYQWIKGQVMLAGIQTWGDEMLKGIGEMSGDAEVTPEETEEAETNRYNASLLEKYNVQLEELDGELEKYRQVQSE